MLLYNPLLAKIAVETFETMDESFAELAQLLQFRDKEQERKEKHQAKKEGNLSVEDKEMDAWDREMKVRVILNPRFCRMMPLIHHISHLSQYDTSGHQLL